MGVDIAEARFFDACARNGGIEGPMLALGSLSIQERPEDIDAFARENGYKALLAEHSVANFFRERYGVAQYVSCDVNGLADVHIDLGIPLPAEHKGQYGSILNGGTLEHVFDMRQAMENIHDAVAVGGIMIHTCPMTWFDHGFVNHNPVLFHLTAKANSYEIVAEGFYYNLGAFANQTKPVVSVVGEDETIPGFGRTNSEMFRGAAALPANCMHLIALRKTSGRAFVVPSQVSY